MNGNDRIGELIAEQTQKVIINQAVAWEEVLRLYVKPKPNWITDAMWKRLINLVVVQSQERL